MLGEPSLRLWPTPASGHCRRKANALGPLPSARKACWENHSEFEPHILRIYLHLNFLTPRGIVIDGERVTACRL